MIELLHKDALFFIIEVMMKKLKKLVFLSLILLTFSSVTEASVGPYLSFDIGGYSRRLEETNPNFANSLKFFGTADSTRLLAKLGMDLNFLDIYATVGGSTLIIDDFDSYHGKMGLAYGGGLKLVMYESPTYEHFKLFINPDVIYYKTNDTIQTYSVSAGAFLTQNHEISFTEYGIKVGGSAQYDLFEPYGGIVLSSLSGQETAVSGQDIWRFGTADIKERDNFGLFLGANIYFDPSGRSSLFVETGGGDSGYFKVGIKTRF
ncbi:MAG: hypothetical protein HY036_05050 [Nitrospirae bacterium]|nr:hypothetical protein [Nitrospirota bacterium]MBI3351928.1 hypothetical protein [Nitrospirota bacterium]